MNVLSRREGGGGRERQTLLLSMRIKKTLLFLSIKMCQKLNISMFLYKTNGKQIETTARPSD